MKRIHLDTVNTLIFMGLLGLSSGLLAAPQVSMSILAEREIRTADENGQIRTRREPASTVAPGDTVHYTLSYSNSGDEAAVNVKLDNPIDPAQLYQAGSAWGDGAQILFSIDGGQTYKQPASLTWRDTGTGKEQAAPPERYTNIRWVIPTIPAGSDGAVGFSATVK
ncbi:MAG: hypothetical protein P1U64_04775 [Alcanivoracaceae bacterium]|nr:hypothetical protein [Alcanivoracaceae bacterium]